MFFIHLFENILLFWSPKGFFSPHFKLFAMLEKSYFPSDISEIFWNI